MDCATNSHPADLPPAGTHPGSLAPWHPGSLHVQSTQDRMAAWRQTPRSRSRGTSDDAFLRQPEEPGAGRLATSMASTWAAACTAPCTHHAPGRRACLHNVANPSSTPDRKAFPRTNVHHHHDAVAGARAPRGAPDAPHGRLAAQAEAAFLKLEAWMTKGRNWRDVKTKQDVHGRTPAETDKSRKAGKKKQSDMAPGLHSPAGTSKRPPCMQYQALTDQGCWRS